MKILIIDDELLIRRSLFRVAKVCGHSTQVAKNGREGVKLWKTFQPDVTFLDIFIPQLNGPDILSAIKKRPQEKVIMISAHRPLSMSKNFSKKDSKDSLFPLNFNLALKGVDLFIPKPFENVWKVIEQAETLYRTEHPTLEVKHQLHGL